MSLDQLSTANAEVAVQGARWLPDLESLRVDPMFEGFSSFLAALGATAWLKQLKFYFTLSRKELPVGTLDALRCMAVQRAGMGRRLEVEATGWLTGDQVQQLNQALAQQTDRQRGLQGATRTGGGGKQGKQRHRREPQEDRKRG